MKEFEYPTPAINERLRTWIAQAEEACAVDGEVPSLSNVFPALQRIVVDAVQAERKDNLETQAEAIEFCADLCS
jgi:hypothetical protein